MSSLHYNGNNSFSFVNDTKIYQFKGKSSEIKPYLLCLEHISKDFTANNMKKRKRKETGLNNDVYDFSIDYNIVDTT